MRCNRTNIAFFDVIIHTSVMHAVGQIRRIELICVNLSNITSLELIIPRAPSSFDSVIVLALLI